MHLPAGLQRFDTFTLRLRILSSLIMAPVILLAVYVGGFAYASVVTCIVGLGFYEWLRLVVPQAREKLVAIACAMLIFIMTVGLLSVSLAAVLAVGCVLALFMLSVRDHDENAVWMALGIPYMAGSGLALLSLRASPVHGGALVFYLLLVVWATDIGAFLVGRLVGGAKLAPSISPSKTWAGLAGGMAFAVVIGYLVAHLSGVLSGVTAIILSPVLAAVAQMGDLFESHFKRRAGVKESGDLIPGHGGVLDRIDGLVFAGVFLAFFQMIAG